MQKSLRIKQFWTMLFLSCVVVCLLIEKEVIYSVDGPIYAMMGKELANRSFSEWVELTWYGKPYFEHPHFFFWLLGISIKLLGPTTLAALLPTLLSGLLLVVLVYALARMIYDHQAGILAVTSLALTPLFIKVTRNPMIECVLMLMITLTLFFSLRSIYTKRVLWTVLTGIALGLAFLTKGPPALLAVGVLVLFYSVSLIIPGWNERFQLTFKSLGVHLLSISAIATAIVLGVDFWYQSRTGVSFFKVYFTNQVIRSFLNAGDEATPFLYFSNFLRNYWPWMPFSLIALPLAIWKRDQKAMQTGLMGFLIVMGTLIGFSISGRKNNWYTHILLPGFALLVGTSFRLLLSEKVVEKFYNRSFLSLATGVLFLCALFPSLFEYPRDGELFLIEASKHMKGALKGQKISVCIPLNDWGKASLISYYFDGIATECNENEHFKIVRSRDTIGNAGYLDRYSSHSFSLLEKEK